MSNQKTQPLNVIFWLSDQQRYDSTGLHGNPLNLTPNLDRLGREGTHLARHYTPHPVCTPARAALQTGCYGSKTGVYRNGIPMPIDPETYPTLPQVFADAGYRTAYFGKWHLAKYPTDPDYAGAVQKHERAGWQDWLGANAFELVSEPYRCVLYDENDEEREYPGYRVDALTDRAIDWLGMPKDKPFCMMLSHLEPHEQNDLGRYVAPRGTAEAYRDAWTPPDLAGSLPRVKHHDRLMDDNVSADLADYWAMCRRLDDALGRLLDTLHSTGLDKNTIVVCTSDHGSHFRTRNYQNKCSGHESSCRVPGVLWGGPFTSGGRINELTDLVDLPPSLADACGLSRPESWQGRSVLDLIERRRDAEPWRDKLLIQVSQTEVARTLVTGRWKYGVTGIDACVRTAPNANKYRESFLYDLQYDPYELANLVGMTSHRELSDQLGNRMHEAMVAVGDPPSEIEAADILSGDQRIVPVEAYSA